MNKQEYTITPRIAFEHLRSHHDESLHKTLLSQGLQRVKLNHFYTNPENFPVNPQLPNDRLENTVLNSIDSPDIIPSTNPIDLRNILALGGDYVARRVGFPRIGDTDHPDIIQINYVNFEGGNIHTAFVLLPDEKFSGRTYGITPIGPGTRDNPGMKVNVNYHHRKEDKPEEPKLYAVGEDFPIQIRVGKR
tara:strand:- start:5087 stop:5659 length:573 start_codon:yes stop_codon:yes gene_type:complete